MSILSSHAYSSTTYPHTTLTTRLSRAPPVPELNHTDEETHSTVDVDSPHISSVPSDYSTQSVKTTTQRDRESRELEDAARQGEEAAANAKAKAKRAAEVVRNNPENPVVFGNALVLAALGITLGVDGWRRYQRGTFGWAAAGAWAGIIGAFAVGDYLVSRLGLQRYPPKK